MQSHDQRLDRCALPLHPQCPRCHRTHCRVFILQGVQERLEWFAFSLFAQHLHRPSPHPPVAIGQGCCHILRKSPNAPCCLPPPLKRQPRRRHHPPTLQPPLL